VRAWLSEYSTPETTRNAGSKDHLDVMTQRTVGSTGLDFTVLMCGGICANQRDLQAILMNDAMIREIRVPFAMCDGSAPLRLCVFFLRCLGVLCALAVHFPMCAHPGRMSLLTPGSSCCGSLVRARATCSISLTPRADR
jgi:hypothetical protein